MSGDNSILARVHENETAGAESRLGHAGPEAGLTYQRGLLVARDAEYRRRNAEVLRRRDAEIG